MNSAPSRRSQRPKRSRLVTYRCPKCDCTIETLRNAQVGHRCPANRSKFTTWKEEAATPVTSG